MEDLDDEEEIIVPKTLTYVNLVTPESDPFHGYKFILKRKTQTRSNLSMFDEMRIAQRGTEFVQEVQPKGRFRSINNNKDYANALRDFKRGVFEIISLNPIVRKKDFDLVKVRANIDALVTYDTDEKQKFLGSQCHILNYIINGNWRSVQLLPGDKIYMIEFGPEGNFPLIWAAVSVNLEKKYMRLHGWAKSLFSEIYYSCFLEQPLPRRLGTFFLSMVVGIFQSNKIYLQALPYTESLLKDILKFNPPAEQVEEARKKKIKLRPVLDVETDLDKEQAAGEPEYFLVNEALKKARDDHLISECILCGAENAGFYFPHLGQATRFCGACPLASRTASAQGLLGQ